MEESTGAGGFQQEICKDAVVRRTFVLPQYRDPNEYPRVPAPACSMGNTPATLKPKKVRV